MVINCIQLYEEIRSRYPSESLVMGYFVNPLLNHIEFNEVQFVYPWGGVCGKFYPKADSIEFAEPLSGPFYKLPVVGLQLKEINKENDEWTWITAIVKLSDESLATSCGIGIRGNSIQVQKELSVLCDNKWYVVDYTVLPWRYTLNELVQESRV